MISLSIILMILLLNRRLPVVMARTMWAPGILWGCGIKISVTGTENINVKDPHVFISNHLSYLDIPVLFRVIPANIYFIAKRELKWLPFIGQYMMATGMLFVNRDNRHKAIISLRKAARLVSKGKNVLMFPEGTRSKDGKVNAFKKGPFHLAKDAGVSVVPIAINGTNHILSNSGKITPGKVTVNIGAPLQSIDYSTINAFIDFSQERVIELQEEGRKQVVAS
ncbi:MAG: lysophospholipid acyltransferase family protein [Bacteroidota bacterium]